MLTSELIRQLQESLEKNGDLPVAVQRGNFSYSGTDVSPPEVEVATAGYDQAYLKDYDREYGDVPDLGGLAPHLVICWDRATWER